MPRIYTEQQMNSELRSQEGIWWLAQNPNKKVFGVLNFLSDRGAVLDIQNHLVSDIADTGAEVIHGESNGIAYTLFGALQGSAQISFGSGSVVMKQEWISNLLFSGIHATSVEEVKFKRLDFETQLLDQWIHLPKFNRERINDKIAITIKDQPKLDFKISETLSGEIHFTHSEKTSNLDLEFRFYPIVSVKSVDGINANDFHRNVLRPFLYLVSLATTGTDHVYCTRGYLDDGSELVNSTPINIYSTFFMSNKPVLKIHSYKHWIRFDKDIDFSLKLMTNWFDLNQANSEVLREYFGIRYSDKSYLEDDFFRIFKVIESWIKTNEVRRSNVDFAEFTEMLNRVEKQITPDDFNQIEKKFEIFLKARECLEIIISLQNQKVQEKLKLWQNFTTKCLNTRNKYAHILSRTPDEIFTPSEQDVAKYILDLLFVSELLKKLNLPIDQYDTALQTNDSWQYLLQHLARIQPE